ncbi:hypothetical protein ACB295_02700 [Aeromonas caviae]
MANEYYERLSEMNPGDLADGLAMEAEFDAIAQGFSKLPTPHTGGQGFEGPVRVGDATAPDEAINKKQLDEAMGTAKQLAVATYGNFNATAWATLPSGTYLLFGTGSQITNSPFTLVAAKTYYFVVRHAIGDNLYFDAVVMSSLDDDVHVDIGREAWRAGPDLVSSAWRAAALKTGALAPLEGLTPAADKIAVFNGPTGAELITLTAFMRTLLDDASLTDTQKTLKLPTAGGFGFRNRLINGGMQIAQRGFNGNTNSGLYCLDRWALSADGASVNWSQHGGPSGSNYASLLFSGSVGNTGVYLNQRIEAVNCVGLIGKKLTLSLKGLTEIVGGIAPVVVIAYPNARDDYSSVTNIQVVPSGVNIPGGGAWSGTLSFTFEPLPSGVNNGLLLAFNFPGIPAGKAVAISEVQLEVGEVATPFEHRPFQTELALCQRYYQTALCDIRMSFVPVYGNSSWTSYATSITPMRASPTIAGAVSGQTNMNAPISPALNFNSGGIIVGATVINSNSSLIVFMGGSSAPPTAGTYCYAECTATLNAEL